MINNSNIEQVKILIKKEESPKIVLAQNDEFNRKILEQCKFNILLSIENGNRKKRDSCDRTEKQSFGIVELPKGIFKETKYFV